MRCWRARDRGAEGEPDDTGGTGVFLSPGLSYSPTKAFNLYGFFQFPVYQYVNGVQLTARKAFTIGANLRFWSAHRRRIRAPRTPTPSRSPRPGTRAASAPRPTSRRRRAGSASDTARGAGRDARGQPPALRADPRRARQDPRAARGAPAPTRCCLIGDDQAENFTADNMPQLLVYTGEDYIADDWDRKHTATIAQPRRRSRASWSAGCSGGRASTSPGRTRFKDGKLLSHAHTEPILYLDARQRHPGRCRCSSTRCIRRRRRAARCYAFGQAIARVIESDLAGQAHRAVRLRRAVAFLAFASLGAPRRLRATSATSAVELRPPDRRVDARAARATSWRASPARADRERRGGAAPVDRDARRARRGEAGIPGLRAALPQHHGDGSRLVVPREVVAACSSCFPVLSRRNAILRARSALIVSVHSRRRRGPDGARVVSHKMGEAMKQPFVVGRTRPGANGSIGAAAVATAAPDGYTMLLTDRGALWRQPEPVTRSFAYDPTAGFRVRRHRLPSPPMCSWSGPKLPVGNAERPRAAG